MKRSTLVFVCLAALAALAQDAVTSASTKPVDHVLDQRSSAPSADRPVTTVLVVRNHSGVNVDMPLPALADTLTARLSGGGLRIVNPFTAVGLDNDGTVSGGTAPEPSALELARGLGADAVVTADITEFLDTALGNPAILHQYSIGLSLNLADSATGAAVCGETVRVTSPKYTTGQVEVNGQTYRSTLLNAAAEECVGKLLANPAVRELRPAQTVTVFFGCNVLGADVEVDGLSLGTCPGEFSVSPGVHTVRVSYPPYYHEFKKQAKFGEKGQTFAVVLQVNPEGEKQRMAALDHERKRAELELWKRERECDIDDKKVDVERKRRELEFEFKKREQDLARELTEGSELFRKQLALADAMLERYSLSGETDDFVRKTIADGMLLYWKNSYGRIAITDGNAQNIAFATPAAAAADLAVPPNPGDIGEGLRALLMRQPGSPLPSPDGKGTAR